MTSVLSLRSQAGFENITRLQLSTIKFPRPAGKLILAQGSSCLGDVWPADHPKVSARARLWGDSEAMFPAVTKEERQGARH